LLLCVDDIPTNVNAEEAARLKQRLMEQFGTVQLTVSGRLSYLGMQIDITRDGDVSFYVKYTLEGVDFPVRASPGTKPTFVVEEGAQKMCEE
jgi:phosphatidate phosphatase PAH1